MQSKRHSLLESCLNVASGMVIGFLISQAAHEWQAQIQKYIWSGFVWNISPGSNVIITTVLTIVSIIRGYFWRRHFNKMVNKHED